MAKMTFLCSGCQARVSVEEEAVGQEGTCPKCNQVVIVPPPIGGAVCPGCGQPVKYSGELAGSSFGCPLCDTTIHAPLGGGVSAQRAPSAAPAATEARPVPKGSFFGKTAWCLVDCVTGDARVVSKFPFDIGSSGAVDWRLDGLRENHCSLVASKGTGLSLVQNDPAAALTLNGLEVEGAAQLKPNADYALTMGTHCFLLRGSKGAEAWLRQIDLRQWFVLEETGRQGPLKVQELEAYVAQRGLDATRTVAFPQGVSERATFLVTHLSEALRSAREQAATRAQQADEAAVAIIEQTRRGALTCPVCWLRLDVGDVMHIAMHENLRGDPILGEDAMLRFYATKFDDDGHALDAMGLACLDVACPHCHRKLPSGFLEMPHHIVSLVGAPSAGKSYYLSVLAKVLPRELFSRFGVVFRDADPTGNAALNVMKNRLFAGTTPEQVHLDKTALEGMMYEKILRQGRLVSLPKPFIFSVMPHWAGEHRCGVVFYDNAGEHFEPGVDDLSSPGAQHVATASTVFFLFDPAANLEFRRSLSGHHDPQLQLNQQLDQQDIILSEMDARLRRMMRIPASERLPRPMAVLVGKCDLWIHLLGEQTLRPVIRDRTLDLAAVAHNSQQVRQLLECTCPEIVANAESLANEVVYFPVSSFGHSPLKLADGRLAPDPKKLRPQYVEVPMVWALARIMPQLIPTTGNSDTT